MPHTENWSRSNVEKLMEISTTLAEYTQSLETCGKIPALLSSALDTGPVTLALLEQPVAEGGEEKVIHTSCSGQITEEGADKTGQIADELLLNITRQNCEVIGCPEVLVGGVQRSNEVRRGNYEVEIPSLPLFPRALVFERAINATHRMCVILHLRSDQTPQSPPVTRILSMIAGQLAKLLRCTCECAADPGVLGTPFNRLTGREWMVVQNLKSEDGEKQLADRMHLSAHTLHSHIKSIYRKVGVQGRLSLLLRVQEAQRNLRWAGAKANADSRWSEIPGDFVSVG